MHYAISYDISDDRLRERVVKILARHGCRRLQKSVFLARDFTAAELSKLRAALAPLMDRLRAPGDSLICLPVERDLLRDNLWAPADAPDDALIQKTYKLLF